MKNAETVITIVGDLSALDSVAAKARAIAGALEVDILHPGMAADILLQAGGADLMARLRREISGNFDVFVQPVANRRKKLFVADMDATIVVGETLDDLAAEAGIKDKIAAITARAMRGELDFQQALKQRVMLLDGLHLASLHKTRDAMEISKGAATLVSTLRRHGVRCVLVSGGFDFFTEHVADKLGFNAHYGNRLEISGGRLTGEVIPPILDKDTKARILGEQNISPADAIAVGDGANDIPMLQKAGTGVGYHAKPAVLAATPHQIRHSDLTALLYLQGYRASEIS